MVLERLHNCAPASLEPPQRGDIKHKFVGVPGAGAGHATQQVLSAGTHLRPNVARRQHALHPGAGASSSGSHPTAENVKCLLQSHRCHSHRCLVHVPRPGVAVSKRGCLPAVHRLPGSTGRDTPTSRSSLLPKANLPAYATGSWLCSSPCQCSSPLVPGLWDKALPVPRRGTAECLTQHRNTEAEGDQPMMRPSASSSHRCGQMPIPEWGFVQCIDLLRKELIKNFFDQENKSIFLAENHF